MGPSQTACNRSAAAKARRPDRQHSTALLYPGNSAPVPGHWQIQGAGEWNAKICFRYGANTWNPVTHQGSDGRDCQSFIGYIYDEVAEIYDGNIFGTRRIGVFARPFPRWPEFVPIRKAVSETGQPIPKGQDKALSKAGK